MANNYLEFEKPIMELESRMEELRQVSSMEGRDCTDELHRLQKKLHQLQRNVYSNLSPWQKTLLARHARRPNILDYVSLMMEEFYELHGDRTYGDDPAIVAGLARLDGIPVAVVGHHKGRNTRENIDRNFGMPAPEGYRKALRIMRLAEKFKMPIITFIDTPGAYPGIGAEERGQGEAIARNLFEMSNLKTPIVVVVSGEGGSGGALAIGVGDVTIILENAVYSVISPESCSSILWRETSKAEEAAKALKMTAQDLEKMGIVDRILPEPLGGAHRNHEEMAETLKTALLEVLEDLSKMPPEQLTANRLERFRKIGAF
ncbi:MAG: acetyl-CoA carboxylase carboxyltransferase subunit alpha [Deltaproteobacteria bacterium]|nr:acetyl-CoA carboxylase carboxyltransferase subunit alpha [Deltaproteobacteria bacterium]